MAKISARGASEIARATTSSSIFLLRSDGVVLTKCRNVPDHWRIFCRFRGTAEQFREKIATMQEIEQWKKDTDQFLRSLRGERNATQQ